MSDDLTRDNPPLSRLTKGELEGAYAINCIDGISEKARRYVHESLAGNTRIAYQSDLAHFERWGGYFPATAEIVAEYLVEHVDVLSTATLVRRIAAISLAHRSRGWNNPTSTALVQSVLRGIRRNKATAQRQARPLLKENLLDVLDITGERLGDLRDRALLLIGFAGAFRRSELVGLNWADIEEVREGIVITLRRSKADQTGAGRKIGIPYARGRWCAVRALSRWKAAAGLDDGALFRPINRHQQIRAARLSGEAVCLIVKARVKAAGLQPMSYSGHSLRAGLCTSAAKAGLPMWKILRQSGHASEAMLSRYIRDAELFADNIVTSIL